MNYYGDHGHGYLGPGAENTSLCLFPNWDQTYDSTISDCSLHKSHNTSVSANFVDYPQPPYNNPSNVWPSLPPEEPLLPEDLADLYIQPLDARSPWPEGVRERALFSANFGDSLAVSPPVAERRRVDPYTLSNHSNIVCNDLHPNVSPNSSFNTSCPMSPEDDRLSSGTEDDTQVPNDQSLGLTKDGRPRQRQPKKTLLHLSEKERRAHERGVNSRSTARYRRKKIQNREILEQQLLRETERKETLEQLYQARTLELTALRNEFYCSSIYSSQ